MKNLYDILGVNNKATKEQIQKAFKKQSIKHHPDKGGNHDKMAELTQAYQILKDDVKRKRYDETGATQDSLNIYTIANEKLIMFFQEFIKDEKA